MLDFTDVLDPEMVFLRIGFGVVGAEGGGISGSGSGA
jgi:hypothetical protein